MSHATVQIDEHAEEVIDRLRKLLAFGPVVTPEAVYEAGVLMSMTGAYFEGQSKLMAREEKLRAVAEHRQTMGERMEAARAVYVPQS